MSLVFVGCLDFKLYQHETCTFFWIRIIFFNYHRNILHKPIYNSTMCQIFNFHKLLLLRKTYVFVFVPRQLCFRDPSREYFPLVVTRVGDVLILYFGEDTEDDKSTIELRCITLAVVVPCHWAFASYEPMIYRNHFVYAPSQWETTLQCNVVSHWLGAFTTWSLDV